MQGVQAPQRSLAQRMEALQRANDIRSFRAEMKRRIKAGEAGLVEPLLDPPREIETMKLWDLLLAAPKVGRVKAHKILGVARISPSKTVGGLSERQRREVVAVVRRRVPRASAWPVEGGSVRR